VLPRRQLPNLDGDLAALKNKGLGIIIIDPILTICHGKKTK
jgi:hypothetical protein